MNRQTRYTRNKHIIQYIIPIILIWAFFHQGMVHARHASITFDEGPHLAVGYTTLRTGDFRLQPVHIHPPLANVLAAVPLLLQHDLPDPRTVGGWQINSLSAITDAVIWRYPHPRHIAIAARLPILGLGVILVALAFRWATDRAGAIAGLVAMTILVFDPNVVAHSSLITTDIAAVTSILVTLYLTDRWIHHERQRPDSRIAINSKYGAPLGIGLSLGLAQLTKVSALMLIPVIVSLLILNTLSRSKTRLQGIRSTLPVLLIILITAILTIWAGYGFEIETVPDLLPLPVPAATHVRILQSLRQHYDLGHPTFAVGRLSRTGWWWYFPLAFLIKTPLPFLILLTSIGIWLIAQFIRPGKIGSVWLQHASLWIFPAFYGAASLFSSVNIGYRHLLPVLPFFAIAVGIAISRFREHMNRTFLPIPWLDVALFTLLLWQAVGTLRVVPHPLTFFNEGVGGPTNGYRYLVDSNLDWGQNLWDLKQWMEQHNESYVNYAHYSPARLQAYGIEGTYLPPDPKSGSLIPWAPSPGLYAIGATVLQGPYAPDANTYTWFRSRTPVARLGHALFIYRVESQLIPGWVVLCDDSGLNADTVRNALKTLELRVLPLDCSQARVRPSDGPGLIVKSGTASPPEDGKFEFTLRDKQGHKVGRIYRVESPALQRNRADPTLESRLTFLDFTVTPPVRPGDALLLHTSWRIEAQAKRSLSIMAHLVAPGGNVVAIGDGLSYPIEYWHPGDILTQTHRLELPEELSATEYTLRTGVYWLDTMERWSAATPEGTTDVINLTRITLP